MATPTRIDTPELIDEVGLDQVELAESLRQVARVDRLLGGERGVRRALRGALRAALKGAPGGALKEALRAARPTDGDGGRHRPTTLLDVGAGNGEVAARTGRWLSTRTGSRVGVLAVDAHPDVIDVGRRETPGVTWIRADGLRLPLADRSVDLVICVLTLHHFDRDGAEALLREMGRVARLRVVVSDLERSRAHWLGARLLAATLWRGNRLTREDGPHSVLRGWTRPELTTLMEAAGLADVQVRRHLPWRLVASGRPGA